MEFKKRLKTRLCISIFTGILGIILMLLGVLRKNADTSSFGLCFVVICIARIRQYKRITKNKETLRQREIAETDERNIILWTKARSIAVAIYMIVCAVAIIILNLIGMSAYANVLSYNLIAFFVIYWICYFIISRKN